MDSCESGIWPWISWVLWLRVSLQAADNMPAGAAASSEGWTGKGCASKLTHVVLAGPCSSQILNWGLQVLAGWWPEAPSIACHMGLSFSEKARKIEDMISYNLMLEVAFLNFCHILLVVTRSCPHAKGKDYTGLEDQRLRTTGGHLQGWRTLCPRGWMTDNQPVKEQDQRQKEKVWKSTGKEIHISGGRRLQILSTGQIEWNGEETMKFVHCRSTWINFAWTILGDWWGLKP